MALVKLNHRRKKKWRSPRDDDPGGGQMRQHPHPHPVLPSRGTGDRGLPGLSGGDRGEQEPAGGLRLPGGGGAEWFIRTRPESIRPVNSRWSSSFRRIPRIA